ncbi:MAG: DUF4340 domain-containing protein [Pseudomonadota bacterium]
MNARTFLLLCVGAAVIGLLAFFAAPGKQTAKTEAQGPMLAGLDINAVTKLHITDGDDNIPLSLAEGVWSLEGLTGLPVDQGKVRAFLLSLGSITIADVKTDNPALHDAVGLGDDAVRIDLGDKGILLGKDASGGGRFGRRMGEDQSYVVRQVTRPQTDIKSWLKLDMPTIPAETVTKVETVIGGDAYTIEKDADGKPVLLGLGEDEALAYDTVLETVIGGAVYIDYESVRLAEGLNWANADTSVFHGAQEGDTVRYSVAKDDDELLWLKADPGGTLAPEGGLDWARYAFEISDYRRGALIKPRTELLAAPDPESDPE